MVCRFVILCNLCLIQYQSILENALGSTCSSSSLEEFAQVGIISSLTDVIFLGKTPAPVFFMRVFLTMDFISLIDIELFSYSLINDFSNFFLKKLYTPCKIYNLWFFMILFYYIVIFASSVVLAPLSLVIFVIVSSVYSY